MNNDLEVRSNESIRTGKFGEDDVADNYAKTLITVTDVQKGTAHGLLVTEKDNLLEHGVDTELIRTPEMTKYSQNVP